MPRLTRATASVVCVCLVTTTSCMKAVPVPAPFDSATISRGKTYRISTLDGQTYRTDKFTFTDSSVVIGAVLDRGVFFDERLQDGHFVEVPLREITEFQRVEFSASKTIVLALVVATIVVVCVVAANSDSGSSGYFPIGLETW